MRLVMTVYCNLGFAHEQSDEHHLAFECYEEVVKLEKTHKISIDRKDIYKFLSVFAAKKNNYREAYDYLKEYEATKDSMYNIEISQKISEINTHYETEKKEKLNLLLQKENQSKADQINAQKATRNYLVIIIVLYCLVILGTLLIFIKIRTC
ncbi:MAG: hypothetical protein IPJ60_07665 [Sphingobacteriaceae bacterium]|nr:hypothetical protein [Sphingobacteriaceae bacterium]